MVRLKVDFAFGHGVYPSGFQFHYGTIKSYSRIAERHAPPLFQFHYGTIKSSPFFYSKKEIKHFNSTMVRLKVYMVTGFQLIYGRFQFHYGTIKRNPPDTPLNTHCYFNSTMVRLKAQTEERTKT